MHGDDFRIVNPVLPPGPFPTDLIFILQATFVGHIVTVEPSGDTRETIRIDDGTGWISSTITKDEEAEDPPTWR